MQITIELPDELVQHFNRDRLAHQILEEAFTPPFNKIRHDKVCSISQLLN